MNGKFHGYGMKQLPDGALFRGYWKKGKMHGKAELRFPDGDIYIGNFHKNKFQKEGNF